MIVGGFSFMGSWVSKPVMIPSFGKSTSSHFINLLQWSTLKRKGEMGLGTLIWLYSCLDVSSLITEKKRLNNSKVPLLHDIFTTMISKHGPKQESKIHWAVLFNDSVISGLVTTYKMLTDKRNTSLIIWRKLRLLPLCLINVLFWPYSSTVLIHHFI